MSDTGADFYAQGTAIFKVYFPEGKVDCRHCTFCRYSEPFNLYRCNLTDAFIEKQDLNRRHINCPIQFDKPEF